MRFLVLVLVLLVGAPMPAGATGPQTEESAPEWVGKHRDDVEKRWGAPNKIKQQRDGVILIYEREVLVRFAYRGEDQTSATYSVEKDDAGKRRLQRQGEPMPEPVYKKVKFKFHVDPEGIVTRVERPKIKGADFSAMPQSAETGDEEAADPGS